MNDEGRMMTPRTAHVVTPRTGHTSGVSPLFRAAVMALLATIALCQTAGAQAKPPASATRAEVLVILAKDEGPMAAELKKIEALHKPPFNAFKSMTVLKKHEIEVAKGKPVDVQLPNGRKLQLQMVEALPDGRFKIKVSINKPKKQDYLPLLQVIASPTEPFFIAGQSFEGGTMIIGVQVGGGAKKASKKAGK